ncbi:hypothetical protein PO124_19555 [Bacillus licheniformis]|nr:hypothetical protein [Bacillus licheniformis]
MPQTLAYLTPGIIAGLGLGAIAAAVMSSMDSSILSASSMAAWNIYRPLIKPKATQNSCKSRQTLNHFVRRGSSGHRAECQKRLYFMVFGFGFSLLHSFPQLTMALFYKRANLYGSIAGFAVAVILRLGGGEPAFGIPPLLPYPMIEDGTVLFPFRTLAAVTAFMTIFAVSELTQRKCPPKQLVLPKKTERRPRGLNRKTPGPGRFSRFMFIFYGMNVMNRFKG